MMIFEIALRFGGLATSRTRAATMVSWPLGKENASVTRPQYWIVLLGSTK